MDIQPRPLDKTAVACGLVALAMGLFIVLSAIEIIPSRGGTDGERWIGVIAGMAFVLGGIAVMIQTWARANATGDLPPGTPKWIRATMFLFCLIIIASLATIGTWAAFGYGPRAFSSSIPFLPAWLNEDIGRAVFGFGAVLTWLILIVMAFAGLKQLRNQK